MQSLLVVVMYIVRVLIHIHYSMLDFHLYNDDEFNSETTPCSYFSYTVRCSSTVYEYREPGLHQESSSKQFHPPACPYSTVAACLAWFQDEGAEMERHYCDTVPPVQLTVYLLLGRKILFVIFLK